MADVSMAPAADMFEMGVQLQVLKRGTLFPMRAQKLYELYRNYESIEEIPLVEKEKLEKQIFWKSLEEVWSETESYFRSRDPHQIERAMNHPKRRMALIFRWYLDSPHAGRTMAKLEGKRTTKSGADLPWEPSMPGSKVPSWKSPQTAGLWTLPKI